MVKKKNLQISEAKIINERCSRILQFALEDFLSPFLPANVNVMSEHVFMRQGVGEDVSVCVMYEEGREEE